MAHLIENYRGYWARIAISVSLLLVVPWLSSDPFTFSITNPIVGIISVYSVFTLIMILLHSKGAISDRQHKYINIFTDAFGITLLLIVGENPASPVCAAYYLLVIHNGINSSARQLLTSSLISITGFAIALNLSSYWSLNIELGVGLILGLLFISMILLREIINNPAEDKLIHTSSVDNPPKKKRTTLKLLFVTNDTKDRHMLLSYIDSWGIHVDIHSSSLRAFAELANNADSDNGYTTVIVDPLNLDMDPVQFAKYIQLDSELSNVHLIHISPEHPTEQKERLLEAGYTTLLKTPIDKTILFDALHTHNAQNTNGKNITKIINHYTSKTCSRFPLDILLAVVDPVEQERFRSILEENGQRVYAVNSGSQVLDALNTHKFDMIILDFKMPDMQGKEIIKLYYYTYLDEEWMPFIALVDEASPEILSQCREAEVNAILVRPVEKKELLITVADIASSKTKRTENIDPQWQPPHIQTAQIRDQDAKILNIMTINQLEKLSSSNNFIGKLIAKFNNDMDVLMQELNNSIDNNCFTDYKDLIYALKDSSCNLGADALHQLSLKALQISQREFQQRAKQVFIEIEETLTKTKHALQNHANKQCSSATESDQ